MPQLARASSRAAPGGDWPRAAIEALNLQPAQQGRDLFGVIVIIVIVRPITILIISVTISLTDWVVTIVVAVGDQQRQQRQHTVGDGHDRVVLPELKECPRPATILGWCGESATDADRVSTLGIARQDVLQPHVMLPAIDEVVFVQEALSDTQTEISQSHTPWVDEAVRAVHTPVDDEATRNRTGAGFFAWCQGQGDQDRLSGCGRPVVERPTSRLGVLESVDSTGLALRRPAPQVGELDVEGLG
jgi:hypothetical protein